MAIPKRDIYMEDLENLAKKQYCETIELTRADIERKNKFRNLTRLLNTLRIEDEADRRASHAKEPTERRKAEIDQEECLAKELDDIKREEIREKCMRQHLRENCHELLDLETKLRAAYVRKAQMAQIAEKEAQKMEEKVKEKEANRILQTAWNSEEEFRTMTKQEEINRKEQYKKELHDQMILLERNKRFEYDEFLREKKMLDDIVQRVHDEDVRAIEERACRMSKEKQAIEAFKAAQDVWKEKQKEAIIEDDRKVKEYLLTKLAEASERKATKEKKEAIKAKICDQIARKMYETERQRHEREEIVVQLMEEEKKEEIKRKHREEVEKLIRGRQEMKASLHQQMAEKEEQLRKQAQQDAIYKEQLLAKIAEDEKLEQLSNEKKRRKLIEIRRTVEQMMTQRRQQKAEDMQKRLKILEDEKRLEEEKKKLIQEERIRMLQEHAYNLIGFLPKGILQPDDLSYLGSELIDGCDENPKRGIEKTN